jgi:hypothetical protein
MEAASLPHDAYRDFATPPQGAALLILDADGAGGLGRFASSILSPRHNGIYRTR